MDDDDLDAEVEVDVFVYDDSDTAETYCERMEMIHRWCKTRDRLFNEITVGKA